MSQRANIVAAIQKASTLQEQAALVAQLDDYDRGLAARQAEARAIDLTDTIVRQTLQPVAVHERSTHETDWLGEVTASAEGDYLNQITAEAALWFQRTSAEVRADIEEFTEQARGMARRTASQYGEQANGAYQQFLQYVAFLRNQAASGLPQVQQLVDSFENPAQNPLPEQTLDNFAPPVHPINEGVSGTETSERNPLLQLVEQTDGGGGQETRHDETPVPYTYAEVPPQAPEQMTSQSMFQPSVAISHSLTMDDFARMAAESAEEEQAEEEDWPIANVNDIGPYGPNPYDGGNYGGDAHRSAGRRQAASGLPQVQQFVDSFENPDPEALPTDVAFPWLLDQGDEQEERSDKKAARQRRAHYVAGLMTRDPRTLNEIERKEIRAFTASLTRTADQFTEGAPQVTRDQVANSPATTPEDSTGSFSQGYAEGRGDYSNGERPTFADDSASAPDFVRGHSEGYQDAAQADVHRGQIPPGAGGRQDFVPNGSGPSAPQEGVPSSRHDSAPHPYTYAEVPPGRPLEASRKTAGLKVSASFVSPLEAQHKDFAKGYKYATRWAPGTPLVTRGSAEFEAGLYAGMSDNGCRQGDWTRLHREAAKRYQNPDFLRRLSMHREFSKRVAKTMPSLRVQGAYLVPVEAKTAATSTDLDTYGPHTSPSPTGQTPINGPGTVPPLAGQTDPAAPGGPSPYNGAEPFGTPVVTNGPAAHGEPTAIDATPGAPVDRAAMEHLSPQSLAFRRTVQANLLNSRQHDGE